MLTESNKKRLSRPEIKKVARCVLEVLRLLHNDGMVHTDIKLDNIFVNHGQGHQRFSEIQLGDCGGVVSQDCSFAEGGQVIGAAFTRSPEATFQLPWGTVTDIWSFGTAILSLVFGGGYHLFNPKVENVEPGSDEYEFTVLKRMHRFFGSYPQSCQDFKDEDTMTIINFINAQGPPAKPFHRVGPREVPSADMEFLLKIMKLDPRDRPIAEELLADVWFTEESQDTRNPLP
jgi:serine/threonine protein kinase